MNDKQKIVTFILALLCNFTFLATAQNSTPVAKKALKIPACDGHYLGKDSLETKRNMAALQDDFKAGSYQTAYQYWSYVFNHAPCSYATIYQYYPYIFAKLIKEDIDSNKQERLVDTLMLAYQAKFKYFPNEANPSKGKYALDFNKYRPNEVEQSMKLFEEYYSEVKDTTYEPLSLLYYMKTALQLYNAKKYTEAQLFDLYSYLNDVAQQSIDKSKDSTTKAFLEKVPAYYDLWLAPLLKCEKIDAIFLPKLEKDPENKLLVRQIVSLYKKAKCTENSNFIPMVEKSFELEPNYDACVALAKHFYNQDNKEKATEYFEKTLELATNESQKAEAYLSLAELSMNSDISKAKSYAQKVLETQPNNGNALIIIAVAYFKTRCGDDFEKAMGASAAIDMMSKAKSVDPSCAEKANQYISSYRGYLPSTEDAFMRSLSDGTSYTIPCSGITTTVRIQK